MSEPITIACQVHFSAGGRGRRCLEQGPKPEAEARPPGRVPPACWPWPCASTSGSAGAKWPAAQRWPRWVTSPAPASARS
jgi:hypothetical protein